MIEDGYLVPAATLSPLQVPRLFNPVLHGFVNYGNYLVPGATPSPLQVGRLSNPVLHAFLVGTVATLITFLATALILDLFLGGKAPGRVTCSDLFTLLHTEDMSFRYLFQIFRRRGPEETKDDGEMVEESTDKDYPVDRNDQLNSTAMFKLFFLLVAVPAINLAVIFLTLEFDNTISFRDAKFGVSLGLPPNRSLVRFERFTRNCAELLTKLDDLSSPVASFVRCEVGLFVAPTAKQSTVIILSSQPDGRIRATVSGGPNAGITSMMHFAMDVEGQVYRLPQSITPEQATELVTIGGEYLSTKECTEFKNDMPSINVVEEKGFLTVTQTFNCVVSTETMSLTHHEFTGYISAVDDSNMRVLSQRDFDIGSEEFESGDDLAFYKRRGSYASIGVLAILLACMMAARYLVLLFTHNDIHLGIELMIKDQLGMNPADSMLQDGSSFEYDSVGRWGGKRGK